MQDSKSSANFGDDLDREVQLWQPDKGDRLIGRVLSVEWVDSRFGPEQYPYLEIDSIDGILYGWNAAQTVPKQAIRRKGVRVGDQIAVKYLGESSNGKYKDFRILVEHADANPDPGQPELFDDGPDLSEPPVEEPH